MNKSRISLVIVSFILVLSLVSFGSAYGVTGDYWYGDENEPARYLELEPGESTVVKLGIQNMVGGENITVEAKIVQGASVASLNKTTYEVPFGEEKGFPVEVSMPEDTEIGEEFKVKLEFDIISAEEGEGTVSIKGGLTKSFPVKAVLKQESKSETEVSQVLIWGIAVLIIIGIIVFFSRKNKKKKSKKKPGKKSK